MIPPHDADFVKRVWYNFDHQTVMTTIGADLALVASGMVKIMLPYRDDLAQQDGFLHAGIVTTIVDSACGYAAFTLMPSGARVLTVEFKVNFVSPARGDFFIATGRVIKAGRTLTVCSGDVVSHQDNTQKQVALMQATMVAVQPQ